MRFSHACVARRAVSLAALALLGLGIAGGASAQVTTVNYSRTYGSPDNRAIILFSTTLNGVADEERDLYIGSQDLELTDFQPSPTIGYCIHIGGVLGQDPIVPYQALVRRMSELAPGNPTSVSSSVRGQGAAWLFNNTPVLNNRDSAALQLAIWEALYDWDGDAFASLLDGNIDLNPGGGNVAFKHTPIVGATDPFLEADAVVTADIRGRADAFLIAWGGQLSDATWLDTNDVTGPLQPPEGRIRQDLITTSQDAPEPGTLALATLVGLPGAVWLRRRTRA